MAVRFRSIYRCLSNWRMIFYAPIKQLYFIEFHCKDIFYIAFSSRAQVFIKKKALKSSFGFVILIHDFVMFYESV